MSDTRQPQPDPSQSIEEQLAIASAITRVDELSSRLEQVKQEVQEELKEISRSDESNKTQLAELKTQLLIERDTAREDSEYTLFQLHKVQDELRQIFLSDKSNKLQLEHLKRQMGSSNRDLNPARKQAGKLLEQSEQYIALSKMQYKLISSSEFLNKRMIHLVAQINS